MTWQTKTLSDLVYFQRGFDITKAQQKHGRIPVISSSGVQSYHTEAKVSGPGVIIGRKGTLGSVHYSETGYWPHDTTLWSKDFRGNDPRFVYYFVKTLNLQKYDTGNSNPTLNRNHIHGIKIRIPDIETQQRISAELTLYDDLIANNTRRIELLEQSARLLFAEWFVRLRYSGHQHDKIVDGVPEGWSRKTLGNIAVTNADSFSRKTLPSKIAYIDIASVKEGRIVGKTLTTSEEAPGRARRRAKDGDVIWSNVRPNLRQFALVLCPNESDVFSTGFTVLSATAVPFSFLYVAVTTDAFVAHLVGHTTGASYPAVRPDDFERAMVLVPPSSLLDEYHAYCEPLLRLSYKLEQENEKLARARDLLLPRLMDGSLSV
jgi:type I restriction enzyme, S subunit